MEDIFTELFNHQYDIDDVISCLCNFDLNANQYLNTATGAIEPSTENTKYYFEIAPLTKDYILRLVKESKLNNQLTTDELSSLESLVNEAKDSSSIKSIMSQGKQGSILREMVKIEALRWLDNNKLIPPSMHHVKMLIAENSISPTKNKVIFN